MKCYYEELGVERDSTESDIKSAYRKLALKWHPDKNPDSMEVAKERFQLIQQAYEVLSDPQERAWYDNHREQILRGKNSDYEDNCLDVYQYFTVTCFNGYDDGDRGFYAIYREVFRRISAEDADFIDSEEELLSIPEFGDSNSNYDDIVGPFYAHWSAYCTKRTYTWLCPYNISEIKDRRILREIEKDMKKIVQKARKERNEEVRHLVSFVRKRDKRVQAHKRVLEERSALNKQKQAQNRLEQIKRRQQEVENMKENSQVGDANDDAYEEQLKQLELEYSSGDEICESADEENEYSIPGNQNYGDGFYCVACNKEFKTEKSFANHEISRKHRDNIETLKEEMKLEENLFQENMHILEADIIKGNNLEEVDGIDNLNSEKQNFVTKNKASKTKQKQIHSTDVLAEEIEEQLLFLGNGEADDEDWDTSNKKSTRKLKNKSKLNKNKSNSFQQQHIQTENASESVAKSEITTNMLKPEIIQLTCQTCNSKFESKNKLFSHLKLNNHGVFIPKAKINIENTKSRKNRAKKNC